jgi:hypothetical protein
MVLSTTKKCQAIQSITNNTCILGGPKKGGLITMQGRNPNLGAAITSRAPYCCVQTNLGCIAGLAYLRANNLMTMNPQCSGGVPHRMYRGCRSSDSSGSGSSAPSTDVQLSSIATQGPANTWTLIASTTIGSGYTLTIPSGTTLIIPVGMTLTVNGTFVINGTHTINGTLINNGSINHNGVITNHNNTIVNNGIMNANSGSQFANFGVINNNNAMMKNAGSTFTNHGTVTGGVTYNGGVINNLGTMTSPIQINFYYIASQIQPSATVWSLNQSILTNNSYTIQPNYQLTIPSGQQLGLYATQVLTNNGTIVIGGTAPTYLSMLGGFFYNNGTVNINNYGVLFDSSTINNTGIINNNNGGGILIGVNGSLVNVNGGVINNYSVLSTTSNGAGIWVNKGTLGNSNTINNNLSATIQLDDGTLNNSSTIVNNGTIQNTSSIINNTGTIGPNPIT